MITCAECIESLPDDPRIKSGFYGFSYCDRYCPKPTYYRELEQITEREVEPEWTRKQWKSVQQLRAMVTHLNNKVKELQAKKKEELFE